MPFSAVGKERLAGKLRGGDISEVQIHERFLCGIIHKDKVTYFSVCHCCILHKNFLHFCFYILGIEKTALRRLLTAGIRLADKLPYNEVLKSVPNFTNRQTAWQGSFPGALVTCQFV